MGVLLPTTKEAAEAAEAAEAVEAAEAAEEAKHTIFYFLRFYMSVFIKTRFRIGW